MIAPIDNYCTGGQGFIGQHLLAKLPEIEKTICIPNDEIADWDYRNCRNFFFLSSYGNMAGQNDAAEILRANVSDTGMVVCHLADKTFDCDSFVFASSSSVNLPVQTPYSHAKRAAEEMILASGISTAIVRLFSVTGVGEQKEHLIPTLIRSCFEGTLVNLVMEPTHDFIDVGDVVDGFLALSYRKATGVFEFGSGITYSNGEVLNLVEEITGRKANVRINQSLARAYDNTQWVCTNFEARNHGWSPKKTLAHSIEDMVKAYRQ